jgi:hypothetical protein
MNSTCTTCGRIIDKFGRKYPPKSVKKIITKPDGYLTPSLAVDSIVTSGQGESLKLLLITRGKSLIVII